MKCTLDGTNAKVIAKAIQSLSKFGSDLFVEADQHGLQLRSLNSTKSAMGTMKFNKNFFEKFNVCAGDENYCRIGMKACLAVFRNMKQVEQCEMCIMPEQSKFQLLLKCRLETVKNALISIVDEENISTDVASGTMPNRITGSHRIFTEISNNFNTVEEEITLEAQKASLTAKNYIEGSRVNDRFMRSQLKLVSAEFDSFKITKEATVTFCLKEFRAFLLFAEAINACIDLDFDEAGSPIFMNIKRFEIECILIMSTLAPDDVSFYGEHSISAVLHNDNDKANDNDKDNANRTVTRSKSQKRKLSSDSDIHAGLAAGAKTRRGIADDTTVSGTSTLFEFNRISGSASGSNHTLCSEDVNVIRAYAGGKGDRSDSPRLPADVETTAFSVPTVQPPHSEVFVTFCNTVDAGAEDDESIPQSPHRRNEARVRSIFSRCFESTYVPKEPSPNSQVYVPDSDVED